MNANIVRLERKLQLPIFSSYEILFARLNIHREVDRISDRLQDYNIERIIHVNGRDITVRLIIYLDILKIETQIPSILIIILKAKKHYQRLSQTVIIF